MIRRVCEVAAIAIAVACAARAQPLRDLSERGAIDCGVGRDAPSNDRVYDCGARALREHKAFYCRYEGAMPIEYVGTRGGLVYEMRRLPGGQLVRTVSMPTRMQGGMHAPSPWKREVIDVARISGIVLVEARFDKGGNVLASRVLEPLPFGVARACEALVRRTRFDPPRLFGVPVAAIANVVVRVTNGKASID